MRARAINRNVRHTICIFDASFTYKHNKIFKLIYTGSSSTQHSHYVLFINCILYTRIRMYIDCGVLIANNEKKNMYTKWCLVVLAPAVTCWCACTTHLSCFEFFSIILCWAQLSVRFLDTRCWYTLKEYTPIKKIIFLCFIFAFYSI